jgi:hypothetical protein
LDNKWSHVNGRIKSNKIISCNKIIEIKELRKILHKGRGKWDDAVTKTVQGLQTTREMMNFNKN